MTEIWQASEKSSENSAIKIENTQEIWKPSRDCNSLTITLGKYNLEAILTQMNGQNQKESWELG